MERLEKMIRQEHDEVKKILEKMMKTQNSNHEQRKELLAELETNLSQHMEAEEKVYYPAMAKNFNLKEEVDESKQEHHVIKMLLRELKSVKLDSPEWLAKVKVIKENVDHHTQEEEEEFLSKSEGDLSRDEANDLASRFEETENQTSV